MSIAQRLPTDPQDAHDEFASIEAAVAGTARGRWFLDEYVRRAQNRDNERIIATLTRIERMLTADAQVKLSEPRPPEFRQPQAARDGAVNFTPSIAAPVASTPASQSQGAALPVLSALRASGALDAPVPAPRPASRPAQIVAPAAKAVQSPARSLADTLEQALLATQQHGGAPGLRPETPLARKPVAAPIPVAPVAKPRVAEVRMPPAPPYVPPAPPYVPPAPVLAPRAPLSPSSPRETSAPIPIDAKAFAHLEAMDAATRAKLFA